MRSSLAVSPSSSRPAGIPVHAATTSAMSSAPTSSLTIAARSLVSAATCSSSASKSGSRRRGSATPARSRPRAGPARRPMRRSSMSTLSSPTRSRPAFSCVPPRPQAAQLLLACRRGRAAASSSRCLRRLVGLAATRQLLHPQPVDRRCSSSISTGEESISIRSRDAASSTRSMALSGRKRDGDVAVGQRGRGDEGGVGDGHLVVRLVLLLDAAQDPDGVLDARLADEHLLEPALQRGVLLDALAVLVQRGGADHAQLAAGQHRLEHVAGVHRRVAARAGADHGVQLVDERDDLAVAALDLVQDGLEPLLELAAVLRPGDHRAEVQRDQRLPRSELGTSPATMRWARPSTTAVLPDARLADEHGVVLGTPREHLDRRGGSRRRGRSPGRSCPRGRAR